MCSRPSPVFTCGGSESGISPPVSRPGVVATSPPTVFHVGRRWPALPELTPGLRPHWKPTAAGGRHLVTWRYLSCRSVHTRLKRAQGSPFRDMDLPRASVKLQEFSHFHPCIWVFWGVVCGLSGRRCSRRLLLLEALPVRLALLSSRGAALQGRVAGQSAGAERPPERRGRATCP